ncbi:MAG TPA: hypothetical protein VNU74_00260 [Terriglobales bacterium]|nr:hypothetical protein [Terriglobales bacterium]
MKNLTAAHVLVGDRQRSKNSLRRHGKENKWGSFDSAEPFASRMARFRSG